MPTCGRAGAAARALSTRRAAGRCWSRPHLEGPVLDASADEGRVVACCSRRARRAHAARERRRRRVVDVEPRAGAVVAPAALSSLRHAAPGLPAPGLPAQVRAPAMQTLLPLGPVLPRGASLSPLPATNLSASEEYVHQPEPYLDTPGVSDASWTEDPDADWALCHAVLQLYASVRRLECASALAQRAAAGDKLMAGLVTSEYGTAGLGVEAAPVFCTYHQWQKKQLS